jgi:hypothetical protein
VVLEGSKTMPVGAWLEGFGIAVASRRAPRQPRVWGAKRAKLQKMKVRPGHVMLLTTSSTRMLDPRFLIYITSCDER